MARPLVLAAHGTTDPAGQAVCHEVAAGVAARLAVPVRLGFVDVCQPTMSQACVGLVAPVVVPAFLSSGYHVRHDLPRVVSTIPGAVLTSALGAEPEVVEALGDRLQAATRGRGPVGGLVVAAAGSSDERARAEVALVAAQLGAATVLAAFAGFLTGPGPTFEEAVTAARAVTAGSGAAVAVSAFLLAPGHFDRQLRRRCAALGLVCAEPIGAHPRVVDLVVRRYLQASGAPD